MKNTKIITVSLAAVLAIGAITANGVLVSADAEKGTIKVAASATPHAEILEEAKSRAVPIKEVEEEELDSMSGGVVHQGIAALLFPYEYQDMNAVIKKWEGKDPIFILFDGVEDVRNLGAIVRTAECAGAACVLLPNHKSSPVTAAAMKTAAGAFAYLPVCRIGNIQQTLKYLKEKGLAIGEVTEYVGS